MLRRKIISPSNIPSISSFYCLLSTSRFISSGVNPEKDAQLSYFERDKYSREEGIDIWRRERGRYYHRKQNLWPSLAALEKDMTKSSFAPAERLPPELLPLDVAALQLEGNIPDDVAEDDVGESQKSRQLSDTAQLEVLKQLDVASLPTGTGRFMEADDVLVEDEDSANGQKKTEKITTEDSSMMMDMDNLAAMAFSSSHSSATSIAAKETTTSNAKNRSSTILADLSTNDVSNPAASWSACGLDPVVEQRATECIGRGASRAQSRLLPALLHDDHNDVIFGSVTGSGKTVALLLAMLQGIRNETSGINIFVCADQVNCQRAVDFMKKFDENGLLDVADTKSDDLATRRIDANFSVDKFGNQNILKDWLMIGDRRENYETYFKELASSLRDDCPKKRMLICTADVMAELLFEKKLEFAPFGNLRRMYFDDISKDIRFAGKNATVEQKKYEVTNPSASQLVLATVHQLMDPQTRSLLQIAAVAADMESDLSKYLLSLCIKPTRHTLIACASRLPTTLHCVFSFYAQHTNDKYEYLTTLLRNASPAIPGRVLIFFPSSVDLLETRALLMREAGLDAKLLFEVKTDYFAGGADGNNNNNGSKVHSSGSSWETGWRYLLLHEHDGFGLDIPYVSHVVLTFCPSNRFSLLHICGRAARGGNPGWVFTVVPRSEAPSIAGLCKELDVDVRKTTIDVNLQNVPENTVNRWICDPLPWNLDPQKIVETRYEKVDAPMPDRNQAMFINQRSSQRNKDFKMEDYTPLEVLNRRFRQTVSLRQDVQNMPELAVEMAREGLLNPNDLKPTQKLLGMFDRNESLPYQAKSGHGYTREDWQREGKRAKGESISKLFQKTPGRRN